MLSHYQIYHEIERYNRNKEEKDKIKFLHGGSSAVFALIGKQIATERRSKKYKGEVEIIEHESMTVDSKLYATGFLRKTFGLHPFGGELGGGVFGEQGKRKTGVNYKKISGMDATPEGAKVTYGYASNVKRLRSLDEFHAGIKRTILYMDRDNCIETMKRLYMKIYNMMLLDPDGAHKKDFYLKLILNERNNIEKSNKNDKILSSQLKKFDKYFARIENLLSGKDIPFKADDSFRKAILDQYPIIYCSTVQGKVFTNGVQGERTVEATLDLLTVKMMFTDSQHVIELRGTLADLGLSEVEVFAFPPREEKVQSDKQQLEDCLDAYFKSGNLDKYNEAILILKNKHISDKDLDDAFRNFVIEYDILLRKAANDSEYLLNVDGAAVSQGYFQRLKQVEFLNAMGYLNNIFKKPDELRVLRELDSPLSKEKLEENIAQLLSHIEDRGDKVKMLGYLYDYLYTNPERPFQDAEREVILYKYDGLRLQLDEFDTLDETTNIFKAVTGNNQVKESKESESAIEHPAHQLIRHISEIESDISHRQEQKEVDQTLLVIYQEMKGVINTIKSVCLKHQHDFIKTEEEFIKIPELAEAMGKYDLLIKQLHSRVNELANEVYKTDIDFSTNSSTMFARRPSQAIAEKDKTSVKNLDEDWSIGAVTTRGRGKNVF